MHSAYYRICMWFSRPRRFSKKTERTHACPPMAKLSRFATVAVSTLTTNVFRSSQPPLDRFRWNENYTRPARPAIAISRRGYACRTLLPCRQTTRAARRYLLPDFSQALEITTYLTDGEHGEIAEDKHNAVK